MKAFEKGIRSKFFVKGRHNGKMRNYYRILDPELGQGAYGKVYKCIYKEDI
jgi:hypothetical protein